MPSAPKYEETLHYVNDPAGPAIVRFWPGNHTYKVWDPGYKDPQTGEIKPLDGQRLGGATSITGVMDKGQGLMYFYMMEMKKYLKQYFRSTTVEEFFNSPLTMEEFIDVASQAHNKKSERGKSVGTDAHAWVEQYLINLRVSQEQGTKFEAPEIPEVEEIMAMLKRSYIALANELKPQNVDDFRKLPRLIFESIEINEALWTEANMLRRSTQAAKEWFELHDITVHGTEGTIYSRQLLTSGKYDADFTVTCTKKCNWCWRNGDTTIDEVDRTMRCMVDFKSSNSSEMFPKGIYPNYLCQTGVYDVGMREEHGIEYDAHLILNGSKDAKFDKQGNAYPVFNSHFSFDVARNRDWAITCAGMKEYMYQADKEIKASL